MKKVFLITLLLISISAESKEIKNKIEPPYRNEIRLGLSESLYYRISIFIKNSVCNTINERYAGSMFLDYYYNFNNHIAIGIKATFLMREYNYEVYNKTNNDEWTRHILQNQFAITSIIIPSLRYSYYTSETVQLYCGIGIGCGARISEYESGVKMIVKGDVQFNLFGISVGTKNLRGSLEITPGFSFDEYNNRGLSYLSAISLGIGYRF